MSMVNKTINGSFDHLTDKQNSNLTTTQIRRSPPQKNGTDVNHLLSPPCYVCNVACIYKSIELLFILCVIANLVLIFCVIRDKRLQKTTYVTLACLALADAAFLSLNLTVSVDVVIKAFSCASFRINEDYFPSFAGTCWCAANGHLTLMSGIRYLILVHPLKAHIHLTIKRVILSSGLVWLVSACLFTTKGILLAKRIISAKRSEEIVFVVWCVSYLIPFLITATLHVIKLRKVRKATKDNTTVYRQTELNRMSRIITIVLILAFVLPIPKFICEVLAKTGIKLNPQSGFLFHLLHIGSILFLLNSGINPFIYAFMSPAFRRSMASLFKCFEIREMILRVISRSSSEPTSPFSSPSAVQKKKVLTSTSNNSSLQSTSGIGQSQHQAQKLEIGVFPDDDVKCEDDATPD